MNIRALICTALAALLFLVSASASNAKETIVFESALKDAVFIPLYMSEHFSQKIIPSAGWWTLKFENGAIISVLREPANPLPKEDIWWIGRTYVVSKKGFGENYFFVRLKEEAEADLDRILTKGSGPAGLQGLSARIRDPALSGKTAKPGGVRQGTDGTNGPTC